MNDQRHDHQSEDRETYEREKRAFLAALEGQDLELIDSEELRRLLRHHQQASGPLDDPTGAAGLLSVEDDDGPDKLGDFELMELLGRGGMGVVYRAVQRNTGQQIAVKFLRPSLATEAFRKRFSREIDALGQLEHPGICRLIAAGTLKTSIGEIPYLAMELVSSEPLIAEADRRGLTIEQRIEILASICETLAAPHALGIIHRDLKPANILLDVDGRPRIVDFGIASLAMPNENEELDEESMGLLGSISYMSPEQLHRGFGPIDARADIFALGTVGFELLAGRLPFGEPDDPPPRVLAAILLDSPPSLQECAPDVPVGVAQVIGCCLSKNPDDRPDTAADVARDLRRGLAGRRPRRFQPWSRRRRPAQLAARASALAVLAVLGGLAAWLSLGSFDIGSRSERATARALAELEAADEGIHLSVRTEESLEKALGSLRRARAELGYLSGTPRSVAIERYIHWRQGEALLFLGAIREDPALLDAARRSFQESYIFPTLEPMTTGLDSTRRIVVRIGEFRSYHPASGQAYIHSELASWSDTRRHLTMAVKYRESAIKLWAKEEGLPGRPFDVPRPHPFLFLDYGRAQVALGREVGDVAIVRAGLRSLDHVDADSLWSESDRFGRAVHHESYGLALATISELTDDELLLRHAFARLDRAAVARGGEAPRAQAGTRLWHARLAIEAADRRGGAPDLLSDAWSECRLALKELEASERRRSASMAQILYARVLVRRGRWLRESVAEGVATLEGLSSGIDSRRDPLLAARWHLARAEAACLGGGSADAVSRELTTVRELIHPDIHPRLWRRQEVLATAAELAGASGSIDPSWLAPYPEAAEHR